MEHPAVLPGHPHVPAGLEHLGDGAAVGCAPIGAVQEEHVGALGFCHRNALEMGVDVVAGEVHVAAEHPAELVHPVVALGAVGTDERVHGQHIHLIVMGLGALGHHPVPQVRIINNMVAAHQARQVEGLAGGVERHGALPGVLAHRLGGSMLMAVEQDVRPDLIRDDQAVVGPVDLHGPCDLLQGPDPAAGVMGGAENRHMDMVLFQFGVHVGVVHPPDALLVPHQRRVDDAVAVVLQRLGEADVGGAVEQHTVAGGGKAGHRRDHPAQHAVLVADAVPGKQRRVRPVAPHLPVDDGVVVGVGGLKIAEGRVLRPPDDGRRHGGHRGEVHVGHPHGDGVKAGLGGARRKPARLAQGIHRDGVLAVAVHDRCEIVLHLTGSFPAGSAACYQDPL